MDSYEVTEKSVPDPYVVGDEPTQTIWLGAGDSKELVFDNLKQPVLKISKVEQGTNTPIPGTVFTVEGIDSDYRQDVTTEADGFATLRVAPGSYRVTEKSVPEPYCLPEDEADRTQTISLNGGDEKTLIFKNSKKPLLTLSKIDADTGVPVPGTVLTVEGIDSDYKDDWTTGADGTGAIIPFSSGLPVTLTTIAGGLAGIPAFVGFGSSAQGLTVLGATIDITNAAGTLSNFAFQVPRAGTITSFSAFFSTTAALSLIGSTVVVTAQIYQSATPNNVFSPIAGTLINLTPSLTGVIAVGTLLNGSLTGLSIPVTARTRLMLVLSASASGLTLLNTVVGYASAGLGIT